jgi:hypothetical protein
VQTAYAWVINGIVIDIRWVFFYNLANWLLAAKYKKYRKRLAGMARLSFCLQRAAM